MKGQKSTRAGSTVAPAAGVFLHHSGDDATQISVAELKQRLTEAEVQCLAAVRERDAAVEELSTCLTRVAHDVAGPVRGISALNEILRRGDPGRLSAGELRLLGEVSKSAERTAQLLKYLSAYAQVSRESASLHREIDLGGAVFAAEAEVCEQIRAVGGRLETGDMPKIRGNPARLQQLFGCLLTNALKYRRSDVPLRIEITARRESDERWAISVADNGRGIERRHRESVFGLFQRLHGNDIPGTGMGLALCRRIVSVHGGRIWVDDNPEGGATVVFTIPAAGKATLPSGVT